MGNLSLLHPWLALGLLGASIPVLIHLIGKRRAPNVRFAAFDFLVAVNKRLARRERLRQLLLLLLRTLAIIALVMAVTRPMPPQRAAATDSSRRLALIVDASTSMRYDLDGTPLLDRAKTKAREIISHLEPGDAVSLIVAGREIHSPFQAPTLDHSSVRAAIDAIDGSDGIADLGTAIENALSQLGADAAGASLVVVSDLAQNSFEQLRPTALDPAPNVRLIDVAERRDPTALGNAAIESLTVQPSPGSPSERTFEVLIRNFGSAPVAARPLELVINGEVTHRAYVDVASRSSEEKTLTHTFEGPGIYRGEVRLVPELSDGYAVDDSATFVTEITRGVRVLAVNGDPRTTPYEDEMFFVVRALEAVPKGDPPIELRLIDADELIMGDTDLSGFDVILLANVANLPPDRVNALGRFVKEGGGLFIGLGNKVRFERANDVFGALLPHPLRDVHQAADADAGTPPLAIGDLDWDHPILTGLGQAVEDSLRASRTERYFNLDVGAGRKSRAVLRFDNGAPALVEKRESDGRVLMLTTSLDVDMTDLALRSAFVAVLQRSMRYLAGEVAYAGRRSIRVGEEVEVYAPTGVRGIALVSPTGKRQEIKLSGQDRRARFKGLAEVGIHEAEVLSESWEETPELSVAVNPTLAESDFMPIRAERVSEALGSGDEEGTISVTVGTGDTSDPFASRGAAPYLLLALSLLFVSESLLASRG